MLRALLAVEIRGRDEATWGIRLATATLTTKPGTTFGRRQREIDGLLRSRLSQNSCPLVPLCGRARMRCRWTRRDSRITGRIVN